MRKLFLLASLLIAPVVSAQELHTFSNGEVADAEKINENFQYVLGNVTSSGGCSAEQVKKSVVVTCADGSSGAIASAGTIIVLPDGQLGDKEFPQYNAGEIVIKDSIGVTLGRWVGGDPSQDDRVYFEGDYWATEREAMISVAINPPPAEIKCIDYACNPAGDREAQAYAVQYKYQMPDCEGDGLLASDNRYQWDPLNEGWVYVTCDAISTLLINSSKKFDFSANTYRCTNRLEQMDHACTQQEVIFPPELLNMTLPFSVEQLP